MQSWIKSPCIAAVRRPKHETRADFRRRLVANDSAIRQIYSRRLLFLSVGAKETVDSFSVYPESSATEELIASLYNPENCLE